VNTPSASLVATELRALILGHLKLEDVETLETQFATLTPQGWVIPPWLVNLRTAVEKRQA
jgi:hypothetical protein